MTMDKALGMIGLARRAGAVFSGSEIVLKAIKSRKAKLVILASDASQATKKAITDSCRFYRTECMEYSDKESLGTCIGGSSCAAVAIGDKNLAGAVRGKINEAVLGKDR